MRAAVAALLATVLLAGCGEAGGGFQSIAEDTHSTARRQAAAARQRLDAKEAQIAQEAQIIQEKEAIALGERYYLKAEGQGWTVIDRYTGQAGSIAYERLTDMTLEDATTAINNLKLDEELRLSR